MYSLIAMCVCVCRWRSTSRPSPPSPRQTACAASSRTTSRAGAPCQRRARSSVTSQTPHTYRQRPTTKVGYCPPRPDWALSPGGHLGSKHQKGEGTELRCSAPSPCWCSEPGWPLHALSLSLSLPLSLSHCWCEGPRWQLCE